MPREMDGTNATETVVLSVYVQSDGRVGSVRVERTSGIKGIDEAVDRCALVEGRIVPQSKDGNSIASWVRVPVKWRLTGIDAP